MVLLSWGVWRVPQALALLPLLLSYKPEHKKRYKGVEKQVSKRVVWIWALALPGAESRVGMWEWEGSSKNPLFIPGNIEERPGHAAGAWHDLRAFWPPCLKCFCPFFFSWQGETSKTPIAMLETWKRIFDLDASKCRGVGTTRLLGKQMTPVNPHSLLGWHVGLGAEHWDVEKSTLRVNELSAQPINGDPCGNRIWSPGSFF